MGWLSRSNNKVEAQYQARLYDREAEALVGISYRAWNSATGVHDLSLSVNMPLSEARVLRAELDAAIGTAEAKAREAARAA